MTTPEINCQLCVVGGGSGGIGAALAAARLGVNTVLVEKNAMLGGNSTVSGVNCWEPVAGATGIPYDIYRELAAIPQATGIYAMGRHCCHADHNTPPFPGGESIIDNTKTYQDTLLRSGTKGLSEDEERCRLQWHGIIFEPKAFNRVAESLFANTSQCRVLLNSSCTSVMRNANGDIDSITLADGTRIKSALWIDNSGLLVTKGGAELLRGEDARSRFNEPGAPECPTDSLNGVTLIFRITAREEEGIDPLPKATPSDCWWTNSFPAMCCVQYPNGDYNCNMLPTMSGTEYQKLGETKAYQECTGRVKAYWHHIQTNYPEFRKYRLKIMADSIGVRETFRVLCETMLTENDLLQGISRQPHDDIIAISDHMMDSHGTKNRKSGELNEPYGIPYRCLIPKGFKNLLVAGRIAGFSTIAASSCRLSRTMIQLGQAAGTAASLALQANDFTAVDIPSLQKSLTEQNVQLTWP